MKQVTIKSIADFIKFYPKVYGQDGVYKDNKTQLIGLVAGEKSAFRSNSWQKMIGIVDGDGTACQCLLTCHKSSANTMVLAFFEALPHRQAAVECLVAWAEQQALERGCTRLVAGLDGHSNYSVGFLASGFEIPPSFGEAYSPDYYNDYFLKLGWTGIPLISQRRNIAEINEENAKRFRFVKHLFKESITLEQADFGGKNFRKTMERYTVISNKIFAKHRYYGQRSAEEDYQLFSPLRLLLNNDNLVFAVENGETVGFLFWYPDFNDFVKPGHAPGVRAFFQYRLCKRQPKALKVVVLGVLPEYEKKGLILLLIDKLSGDVSRGYPQIQEAISSWVFGENEKSKDMTERILNSRYKEFVCYEKEI